MTGTSRRWLIGCGIGCGALLILFGLLAGGGYFLVNRIVNELQDTESSMEAMTAQFGRISEFVPAADSTVPGARLEIFLAVREQLAPARREIEGHLGLLAEGQREKLSLSPLKILKLMRAGATTLPLIFKYLTQRNAALSEHGMGLGEYLYLYAVVYYSWLQKSPADGPPFTLLGDPDEEDEDSAGFRLRVVGSGSNDAEDETEVRQRRRERALKYLNRQLLAMLRHQLVGVACGTSDADATPWQQTLAAEIRALESDPYRLPWQEGMPQQLVDSLAPYRSRLEASYSALANHLELAPYQDD